MLALHWYLSNARTVCKTLRVWDALSFTAFICITSGYISSQYIYGFCTTGKSKISVLLVEYNIMIAYGDVGIVPRIHNLRDTWRWEAIFMSRPLYPWQWKPDVCWTGDFVGPGTFWTLWRRQMSLSDGNRTHGHSIGQTFPFHICADCFTGGWRANYFHLNQKDEICIRSGVM